MPQSGMTTLGDKHYLLVTSSKANFATANSSCIGMGLKLATVATQEEYDNVILTMASKHDINMKILIRICDDKSK